ncbi:uncharacterized protein DNG_01274 [Cephalotrichum gorgonifer]|uniref:Uncharacterized protein n=1 Tax=Cephalotrichum gorgonifer TaxID=2041049 RepID=A0AAE8MQ89_9PEZI|nr:uncharacterized protein DNG_01274 [Cephalotrichum gorgonifer]
MCSAENIQYDCGHWGHEIRDTCAKGGINPRHCSALVKSGARKELRVCDLCQRRLCAGSACRRWAGNLTGPDDWTGRVVQGF